MGEAIKFLEANGATHARWAKYFEDNPAVEAEYLATGVWDSAQEHRRLEAGYEAAISLIRYFAAAPAHGDEGLLREALQEPRPIDGFIRMHFEECDYFTSRGTKPCTMDCCS